MLFDLFSFLVGGVIGLAVGVALFKLILIEELERQTVFLASLIKTERG